MHSDRDIEAELQDKRENTPYPEWEPWGPIEVPEDYGDFELYADHLKVEGKYGSAETLQSARSNVIQFCENSQVTNSPTGFGDREAELFKNWLENKGLSESSVNTYISSMNKMASFFVSAGYYDGNPFSNLTENRDTDSRSTGLISHRRVELELPKLRNAVENVGLKNSRSVIVIMLSKTGIRISELCNLDTRDVYIDHPIWEQMYGQPRPELSDKPDAIWIDPNKERGEISPMNNGNKRKVSTPLPIDNELKRLLLWYSVTAPVNKSEGATPFFRSNQQNIGRRLSTDNGTDRVINWAKENDLHKSGQDEMQNVTAHRFRSLFSNRMYRRLDSEDIGGFGVDRFVKGLRGDVGQDVLDEYIGLFDRYRDPVTDAMIKFGITSQSI